MRTMGSNPLCWVDNLLDKIVAFQDEVEENICQGPVKYVEDQVKTVGVNVKKFYSNVMKDMEHLAHDEVNREHSQLIKKDSFIKKVYSEVKKELSEVKKEFSGFVDDVIFENSQTNLTQDVTFYNSEVSAEKELSSNQSSNKNSFSKVKNESVDIADEDISEKSHANSSRIIVDVDSSSTTTQVKSTTTDIDNGSMWFEEDKVNEELLSTSDNISEQLSRSHTRQNERAEINLSVVNNCQEVSFQSETSVPEVDQASDSREAALEGTTTLSSYENGTESGNTTDETVEMYDHQGMIKLGESCVLVDRTEEGCIPYTPRGQQRSYKKKIRDVVLRRWTRNSYSKNQLYPVVESMEPAEPTTSTGGSSSSRAIVVAKSQSQTEDSAELEWELI